MATRAKRIGALVTSLYLVVGSLLDYFRSGLGAKDIGASWYPYHDFLNCVEVLRALFWGRLF